MSGAAVLIRGALFDLDGTLADTSGDLIAGANAALAQLGVDGRLDPKSDAGLAGHGGRAMLREGFARSSSRLDASAIEENVSRAFDPFLAAYEARIAQTTRLFPGVEAALDSLHAGGWRLAVCTNKPERLARILLDELGVLDRFAAVLGADTLPVRKPDPEHVLETARRAGAEPFASVLIGDTITDRHAARAAGVPCVLVDFGLSRDPPASLSPEAILGDFAELDSILEILVPAA